MNLLTEQRCFNHLSREAAARCPECRRHFCRECVTEHEGRVLCSVCLRKVCNPATPIRKRNAVAIQLLHGLAAFVMIWAIFYSIGQLLLLLPDSFHDGTLWQDVPWRKL